MAISESIRAAMASLSDHQVEFDCFVQSLIEADKTGENPLIHAVCCQLNRCKEAAERLETLISQASEAVSEA